MTKNVFELRRKYSTLAKCRQKTYIAQAAALVQSLWQRLLRFPACTAEPHTTQVLNPVKQRLPQSIVSPVQPISERIRRSVNSWHTFSQTWQKSVVVEASAVALATVDAVIAAAATVAVVDAVPGAARMRKRSGFLAQSLDVWYSRSAPIPREKWLCFVSSMGITAANRLVTRVAQGELSFCIWTCRERSRAWSRSICSPCP
jgi:hypothetical protein